MTNVEERQYILRVSVISSVIFIMFGLFIVSAVYSGIATGNNGDYDTRSLSQLNQYKPVTLTNATIKTDNDRFDKYVTGISSDRVTYDVRFYNKQLINIPSNGIITVYVTSDDEYSGYQNKQEILNAKTQVRKSDERFDKAYHRDIKYKPIAGFILITLGIIVLVGGLTLYYKSGKTISKRKLGLPL